MRATWPQLTSTVAFVLGLATPEARAEPPSPAESQESPAPPERTVSSAAGPAAPERADMPERADPREPVRGPVASRMWWFVPRPTAEDLQLSGDAPGSPLRTGKRVQGLVWIPRLVLFVPQTAIILLTQPGRLLLYYEDRYKVIERARRFFFNDAETFGIYPTFFYATGFGLSAGARLVHRDLFGQKEQLSIDAGFGGIERQIYELSADTGRRLESFELGLNGGYEATNRHRFYTIGNVDQVAPEDVLGMLDAQEADVAVRTRFNLHTWWATVSAQARIAPRFTIEASERLRHRAFSVGSEDVQTPWITDVYASQTLVGYRDQSDSYTGLHASYGGTRSMSVLAPADIPTQGARVDLWGGYQRGIASPFHFGRAGFDAQAFIHLFGGNRIFRLRLRMDSVIGDDDRIPFIDYPSLGGWLLLRGYNRDRFRDHIAAVTTAEYRFPLVYQTSAYLFVDTGRVYHRVEDLGFEDLRVGYGGGLILVSRLHFLASALIASSIDGGVYAWINLSTNDALGPID